MYCAILAIGAWLLMNPPCAEAQTPEEPSRKPQWGGSWQPPEPDRAGWDWIRVESNEWVKGEILLMRNFDLHFDSDEFGVVKIDWEDVEEILTERVYIFVLEDLTTQYVGTAVMRDGQLSIRVGGKVEKFDRSELLAITPSAHRELNLWSGRASLGLGLRSGNTESSDIVGSASLAREGTNTRAEIDYSGVYGSVNKVKNTNNHRGSMTLDYLLTPDFFLTPGTFEVFTDEFQNISYRLTPTVGIGYFLVRQPEFEWIGRFSVGYQHMRSDSARLNNSATADNSATVFKTSVEVELTSVLDLILDYQLQFITPDTEKTNHHAEATLKLEVTGDIDLDLTFVWDRIEDPETDSKGKQPDTDDFRLNLGLALKF